MKKIEYSWIAAAALALAACGDKPQPAPLPPQAGTGEVAAPAADVGASAAADSAAAPTDPADLVAALAAADVKAGETTFLQCRACHSLMATNEPGKIGPTLHGVIGRTAGSAADFAYSDALAKSGVTWTVEELDKWLHKPSDYLPGNKMVYVGLDKLQDRANVIAYIQQESTAPAP